MFIALCTTGFSSLRLERHVLVFHQNMTLSYSLGALETIGFLVRVISVNSWSGSCLTGTIHELTQNQAANMALLTERGSIQRNRL